MGQPLDQTYHKTGERALSKGLLAALVSANIVPGDDDPWECRESPQAFTASLFGFLPSWRATRGDLQLALRSGARGATGSRASAKPHSTLVACEVGLSGLLVIVAAASSRANAIVLFEALRPGDENPDAAPEGSAANPALRPRELSGGLHGRLDSLAARPRRHPCSRIPSGPWNSATADNAGGR